MANNRGQGPEHAIPGRGWAAPGPWPRWGGSAAVAALVLASLGLCAAAGAPALTWLLVAAGCAIFLVCWASAFALHGPAAAARLLWLALGLGWSIEQLGVLTGWPFGPFHYTGVLGPRLGQVPLVIPMLWFSLCMSANVLAQMVLRRRPLALRHDAQGGSILLAAALVTAFDLGAKTFFVQQLQAWTETEGHGQGWFGLGLQGFAGWFISATLILAAHARWSPAPQGEPRVAEAPAAWPAALPLALYFAALAFFVWVGQPSEARVAVLFAMGLPLLVAVAVWPQWQQAQLGRVQAQASSALPAPIDRARLAQTLQAQRRLGDAAADGLLTAVAALPGGLARLSVLFNGFGNNGQLRAWSGGRHADPVEQQLADFVAQALQFPRWVDLTELRRAQALFFDFGPVPSAIMFCASLPQVYVEPEIAATLSATGMSEHAAWRRIRMVGAMVFLAMMKGGLQDADQHGLSAVLKVRLIHAMVRHGLKAQGGPGRAVPINQTELAYVQLCFSLLLLRGLRRLDVQLPGHDQRALLHAWNLIGHVLGMGSALMAFTMADADAVFDSVHAQAMAAAPALVPPPPAPPLPDPRQALTDALLDSIAKLLPIPLLKPMPVLLMRLLCGRATATRLGLDRHAVPWSTRLAFGLAMGLARVCDAVGRCFDPDFALSRLFARALGYRLVSGLLLAEVLPAAPGGLPLAPPLPQASGLSAGAAARLRQLFAVEWQAARRGPGWMKRGEDRLSGSPPQ